MGHDGKPRALSPDMVPSQLGPDQRHKRHGSLGKTQTKWILTPDPRALGPEAGPNRIGS